MGILAKKKNDRPTVDRPAAQTVTTLDDRAGSSNMAAAARSNTAAAASNTASNTLEPALAAHLRTLLADHPPAPCSNIDLTTLARCDTHFFWLDAYGGGPHCAQCRPWPMAAMVRAKLFVVPVLDASGLPEIPEAFAWEISPRRGFVLSIEDFLNPATSAESPPWMEQAGAGLAGSGFIVDRTIGPPPGMTGEEWWGTLLPWTEVELPSRGEKKMNPVS